MSRRVLLLLGLVIAVVAAGVAWPVYAAHVAGDVRMSWAGEPVCSGTQVVHKPHDLNEEDPDVPRVPVVQIRPGMRCVVTLEVDNESSRSVHLRSIHADGMGPLSGAGITAEPRAISGAHPDPSDDLGMVFPVDEDLPADDSLELEVTFVYSEKGCTDRGGLLGLTRWPRLDFSALGQSHSTEANDDLHLTAVTSLKGGCPDN